jgi:hypothetical protein
MKSLTIELTKDIFTAFALTNEDMIKVRGGEGEPQPMPTPPPIKI